MSDHLRLSVSWKDTPGYPRSDINMRAPSPMVAAALKELCSSSFALENIKELKVVQDG